MPPKRTAAKQGGALTICRRDQNPQEMFWGVGVMVSGFLTLVGVAYVALAVWCAVLPATTAAAVGFDLRPGGGQSEYLTVYGGLQLALGLAFLRPLVWPAETASMLQLCLLIHGCLIVFRAISFLQYGGIPTTTYILAGVEWAIFLGALVVWRLPRV